MLHEILTHLYLLLWGNDGYTLKAREALRTADFNYRNEVLINYRPQSAVRYLILIMDADGKVMSVFVDVL